MTIQHDSKHDTRHDTRPSAQPSTGHDTGADGRQRGLRPTLGSADYCSPEVYELDRRRIFHAGWMYVCHIDGLPAGS